MANYCLLDRHALDSYKKEGIKAVPEGGGSKFIITQEVLRIWNRGENSGRQLTERHFTALLRALQIDVSLEKHPEDYEYEVTIKKIKGV